MIRRTVHFTFQFIGVLAVGLAIASIWFFWRLSSGPLSIAYLTPYFESALSPDDHKLRVKLDDTIITWADVGRTLDIRLLGAKAISADNNLIVEIPELSVSLSASALLRGRLAPRTLSISGASLKVVRDADGNIDFGLSGETVATNAFVRNLISGLLRRSDGTRAIDYLARLNILDATLSIDDRKLGVIWDAPDANITLTRTPRGVIGQTDLELRVKDQVAALQVNADYDVRARIIDVNIGFADFNPSIFAELSKQAAVLSNFDLPASGTISFKTDLGGKIEAVDFNLSGAAGYFGGSELFPVRSRVQSAHFSGTYDQRLDRLRLEDLTVAFGKDGRLTLPAPLNHVLPITKIRLQGTYSREFDRVDIQKFEIITPGPKATGSATFQEIGNELTITVDVDAGGFGADQSKLYWPASLAPDPRKWVVKNISGGTLDKARLKLVGRWSEKKGFGIDSLTGDMRLNDLTIDYFNPMPRVTNVGARVKFDHRQIDFTLTSGRSGDLVINGGRILLTGLNNIDQFADLDLNIDGPVASALKALDSGPLGFARDLNIKPAAAQGTTSTRLKLNFLIENKMSADAIKVSASSTLDDVSLPGVAFGFNLEKSDLFLSLDNLGMDVKGLANLNGIATEFNWRRNFEISDVVSRYRMRAKLTNNDFREKLGVKIPGLDAERMKGVVGTDLDIKIDQAGVGTLAAKMNLTRTEINLPSLGWSKKSGEAASIVAGASFAKGRFQGASNISLSGNGLEAEASLNFDATGKVNKIRVARLKMGDSDIAGVIIPNGEGWEIDIRGKKFDLSRWVNEDREEAATERGAPVTVSFSLEQAVLSDGGALKISPAPASSTVLFGGKLASKASLIPAKRSA
ncbi:MAG: hypothetical protein HQ503_18505 [Rhodospirillales bacterium]|nr:hypothetical protein [Rhodospirillales bacterium]